MSNRPVRLRSVAALTDATALEAALGPLVELRRAPFLTNGYSGSVFERLEAERQGGKALNLVLKRTRLSEDWTAVRTGDIVGREAALLDTPALTGVWDVYSCPYRAYAIQDGEIAVLMDDLSEHFFPDIDEPLSQADEDVLLRTLATLHARFWDSEVLDSPWLATPAGFFGVLGPHSVDCGEPFFPLSDTVREGWRSALARLPAPIAGVLATPAGELARMCEGLPRTLLHGDAKVANFAVLNGDRCAAIDWAWAGAGPPTVDLGLYLAVNAGRLARSKEEVVVRYRSLLETRLRANLSEEVWERLLDIGILCGALMLLWSKASALESGSAKAATEWEWWVSQLQQIQSRYQTPSSEEPNARPA